MLDQNLIEFSKMDKRVRAAFVNSLSGFKSANLLGTIDLKGQTNLSIVSSCFHLGADPALMGLIIRPHTTARHSFENILETKEFTLNHVHSSIVEKAHQCSARYPKEVSEFEACGLTPSFKNNHKAPYVNESLIQIGLKLREHQLISLNSTELIIGEIIQVYAPQECLSLDGFLDIEQAQTVCVSGLDSYHKTQRLKRLSYAKPDKKLEEIDTPMKNS